MGNEFVDWQIRLYHPGELLLVGMLVCLVGMLITTIIMASISKFFYYQPSKLAATNQPLFLLRFSIMALELPGKKFDEIIQGVNKKTVEALQWQLKVDYYFMPFAYFFLVLAGSFVHLVYASENIVFDPSCFLVWLPFVAWVFDIVENVLISATLSTQTTSRKGAILFFSAFKWLVVVGCLLFDVFAYLVR